jgi:DNA-binding NarL/FixJ family response regulator
MKPPLYIRPLTPAEHQQLEAGLRSSDAFTLRRCQILRASACGQRPAQIARQLGCATQSVRNAIHERNQLLA